MKRVFGPEPWSDGLQAQGDAGQSAEGNEKAIELAQDILNECRAMLMMRHRFLDSALWQMEPNPESSEQPFATDGIKFNFDPMLTILRYHDNMNESVRDYLHLILHCIFRHPFDDAHANDQAWSLACDILVESVALDMAAGRFDSELDDVRRVALEKVREVCGTLNTNRLYHIFSEIFEKEDEPAAFNDEFDEMGPYEEQIGETTYALLMKAAIDQISPQRGLTMANLCTLKDLFVRDSHGKWDPEGTSSTKGGGDAPKKGEANRGGLHLANEGQNEQDGEDDTQEPEQQEQNEPREGELQKENQREEDPEEHQEPDDSEDSSTSDKGSRSDASQDSDFDPLQKTQLDQAQKEWEQIAKQVEMELDSNKLWGNEAGDFTQALIMANRSKCDYEDFLRKFSSLKEDIKTNEDEFDYIYYTYGLERYGNMPLVEPLEYKETDRVREFVIALDTSESCSGELIATFVRRTFEIIKETEVFGSEVNIHIIQCDAKVQSDDKVESIEDLDEWLEGFEVRGLGGTSFAPVFEYVDGLIEDDEFEDLCGLIYFTDGLGLYPNRRPEYDTAFVFMNNEPIAVQVPPWAMKVVMTEDEVREL